MTQLFALVVIYIPMFFIVPSTAVGLIFYLTTGYFKIPFSVTIVFLVVWTLSSLILAIHDSIR